MNTTNPSQKDSLATDLRSDGVPKVKLGEPLSFEQIEYVHSVRDEFMTSALSTDPVDRDAAEEAVQELYKLHDFTAPKILWMESPLGGAFAAAALENRDKLTKEIVEDIDYIEHSVWGKMKTQLSAERFEDIADKIYNGLMLSLDELGVKIQRPALERLLAKEGLSKEINGHMSAWRDAYWIAQYICSLEFSGLPSSPKLDALAAVCHNTGWWWPLDDYVVLTEKPIRICRDDEARLHSDNGPALEYADGYQLYSWHGTTVPAWIVENPTLEQAMKEENTEIRRSAFESLGWDRVVEELNMEPIDTCEDPANKPNELQLYRLPDKYNPYREPVNLLLMVNGSPDRSGQIRRYGETVPHTIKTAIEAAAWQYDVTPEVYKQLERRT